MKMVFFSFALLFFSLSAQAVAETRLHIFNKGSDSIEIFWIAPDGHRASNGKVAPGKDHMILTTIGHRFVIVDGAKETEVVSSVALQTFHYHPASKNSAGPDTHEERLLAGWRVQVNTKLIEQDAPALEKALQLLRDQLDKIVRVVPPKAVTELQKVVLWMNPEYPGVAPKAEFHPDARWLADNGRDAAMAQGVELTNVRIFEAETRRMPNFALHELAHAYHFRVLPMGFGNREVKSAYQQAKASGKYERVEVRDSEGRSNMKRAYALVNPQEYFAETTEAYFSRNDMFPFNRAELEKHDPEVFSLLARLWGT
ncbi:hypothetical protein WJU23_15645 [Prosthecobacter sp. SYSU 5D2]|uniref:hypothetical protein n=1 Tax=Prosthecobacter sp. SYSU 5D2 TaxID=3134134 RepID=UPI0031FE7352